MTEDGSGTRPARDRRLLPAFVVVAIGLIAIALASQARPATALVPFPSAPAEACHAPASVDKGGQTLAFNWQVAVEMDRPQGSAIVFASGADTLLCFVSRSADGMLGIVSSGIGGHRGDPRSGLTLDSGMSTPTHERDILVGRVPTGTATVRVGAGDAAAVGNGYYLAWLAGPAAPVRIDALDASGHLLQRLEDPNGIQFGS